MLVDHRFYPEYKGKNVSDILNEQLFLIGMTLKGNSWIDLNNLCDMDRLWLYKKCVEYWEKQEEELNRAKRKY